MCIDGEYDDVEYITSPYREADHMPDTKMSHAVINSSDVESGVQKERDRILSEIEDTLVDWSYPDSTVAPDIRAVLMNLGMWVVNAEHTEQSVKKAEEWLDRAEGIVDSQYSEMEAHFSALRKKNCKRRLAIVSAALALASSVYIIIKRVYRRRNT